jgi:hypothetical protein
MTEGSTRSSTRSATVLGVLLLLGFVGLGYVVSDGARSVKRMERVVTVKGLSEVEVPADIVIWPIVFQIANEDLNALYSEIESTNQRIAKFLADNGIEGSDISGSTPAVSDLHANNYGNKANIRFRYTATSTVTVYSNNIDIVRKTMGNVVALGKQGIAVTGNQYGSQIQFLFTDLNSLKPKMIEEATANARAVAEKFAADSNSKLGKIKSAQQGQFSISDRDTSTPHIKKVRVVSTVESYLTD